MVNNPISLEIEAIKLNMFDEVCAEAELDSVNLFDLVPEDFLRRE